MGEIGRQICTGQSVSPKEEVVSSTCKETGVNWEGLYVGDTSELS